MSVGQHENITRCETWPWWSYRGSMWFRMPNHTSFVRVQLGHSGLGHTDGKVLMVSLSEKAFREGGRRGVAHGTPVFLDAMLGIA